ncbi:unnamed protein product [Symbiodinium sp. CCMP2592]|nr:unnamed protein product [Symbiodinium sp. CCMP2592]
MRCSLACSLLFAFAACTCCGQAAEGGDDSCMDDAELLQTAQYRDRAQDSGFIDWLLKAGKMLYDLYERAIHVSGVNLGYTIDMQPMQHQPPYVPAFGRKMWLYATASACNIDQLKNWPKDLKP